MSKTVRIRARMCEVSAGDLEHLTLEQIEKGLSNLKEKITEWCYLLHDKDTKEDGTPKSPHYHCFLHFNEHVDFSVIAKAFNVDIGNVQKIKCGSYDGGILYLTHKNTPEKYQYNPLDVVANFAYIAVLQKYDRAKTREARLAEIRKGIESGAIKRFNLTNFVSMDEYHKLKKPIEDYFAYMDMIAANTERRKTCIFITGGSGCGKSYMAKEFAKSKGLSYFVSGSSNDPLDGYDGQDVLILDDFRGSSFRFQDFIKLVDPNTDSRVKCRYKNKILECKYIIVTSVQSVDEFYNNIKDREYEPTKQINRRFRYVFEVDREMVFVHEYKEEFESFCRVDILENYCPYVIKPEYKDKEDFLLSHGYICCDEDLEVTRIEDIVA